MMACCLQEGPKSHTLLAGRPAPARKRTGAGRDSKAMYRRTSSRRMRHPSYSYAVEFFQSRSAGRGLALWGPRFSSQQSYPTLALSLPSLSGSFLFCSDASEALASCNAIILSLSFSFSFLSFFVLSPLLSLHTTLDRRHSRTSPFCACPARSADHPDRDDSKPVAAQPKSPLPPSSRPVSPSPLTRLRPPARSDCCYGSVLCAMRWSATVLVLPHALDKSMVQGSLRFE